MEKNHLHRQIRIWPFLSLWACPKSLQTILGCRCALASTTRRLLLMAGSTPETEVFRIDLHSKIKHGTWRIVFGWFWNMFLMLFSNGNHTLKVYQPIFLCQHLHFLCLVITSIFILLVKDDQHHHENPHSCDFLRYPYLLYLHVCWAPYATLLGLQKSNPNVCLVKSSQIPEVSGQTNSIHINVVKTIVISPIFDSLYQPFMVILGIVYYCFNHIHYCWLNQATDFCWFNEVQSWVDQERTSFLSPIHGRLGSLSHVIAQTHFPFRRQGWIHRLHKSLHFWVAIIPHPLIILGIGIPEFYGILGYGSNLYYTHFRIL